MKKSTRMHAQHTYINFGQHLGARRYKTISKENINIITHLHVDIAYHMV